MTGNYGTGLYGWSDGSGGVHHYRMAEPIRAAAALGIPTGVGDRLDDEVCARFDTVLVHMLWDEHNTEGWRTLADKGQHRLVFDVDDVMWSPDWQPFRNAYTPKTLERVYENMRRAHVITTPSTVIADHVRTVIKHPNVWVCPNTVPEYLLKLRMPQRPQPWPDKPWSPYVIGYQGSPSHQHDWTRRISAELLRFLDTYTKWTAHFWGPDEIPGWPRDRVGHTPWQSNVRQYYMSLSMDIGLGPLKHSPFNAGKSSLRAVEYAALGIPAVLSDIDPYTRGDTPGGIGLVEHGVTGLLLGPRDSWYDAVRFLADHSAERADMGDNARKRAAEWTTETNIHRWMEAWNSA